MKMIVDRFGDNGEGIAILTDHAVPGKVCFVDGAIPGEIIDAEIIDVKPRYFRAKLNKIISKSDARCEPVCPYFSVCGGCDLQHITRKMQEDFKISKVSNAINKVQKVDNVKLFRLNNWKYRNKMSFCIGQEDDRNIIGMFAKKSHHIIEIDKCLLASENVNAILNITRDYLKLTKYKGFEFQQKTGDLKYLVIREMGNNILVTIVANKKIQLEDYYLLLKSKYTNIGLSIVISDNSSDILGGKYMHLYGNEYLEISEFGICYKLNNLGFLQVNNEIKNKMYSRVLDEINERDRVIDAYSGAGLMSAIIAQKCSECIGIEINKSANKSAKTLLKENDISNVNYICGDVKSLLKNVLKKNDVVILDPPRAGCDKSVLAQLMTDNYEPKKIIYISCNLSTLIRDLMILKDKYFIEAVMAYDMFVQSAHVETMVILRRKYEKN